MLHNLCVFCGSRVGANPLYVEQTRRLGQSLARRGIGLVYGAGHIGLMGVLADAVLEQGGQAIGVIPQALVERELAHQGLTKLHVVARMHERRPLMAAPADASLAVPGGYGTGDEPFERLAWSRLKLQAKPIGVLNLAGFFDPLFAWIDRCVAEDFLKPCYRDFVFVEDD